MKHTKGEWKINPFNKLSIIDSFTDGYGNLIAQVNGKEGEEREANAALIAAAPELLEALIELTYQLTGEQEAEDELEKSLGITLAMRVQQAKHAINKATE